MRGTVTGKLIESHLAEGDLDPGSQISVNIDQVLCQDATGTTVANYLTGITGLKKIKPKTGIFYHDHNIVGFGEPRNANDGRYLETVAAKYGCWFSKAGGGICHDVHMPYFSRAGEIMIGSDSHTPTMGAVGMLAIGTGGMNVVVAMITGTFQFTCPSVVGVKLTGEFPPFVEAKDLILEVLRRRGTSSTVNAVLEYYGPGAEKMSVEQRATVVNMGAEVGATTSLFASDEKTRRYFESQGREEAWSELLPDKDAAYDETMEIDLSELEPLVAVPHNPGNIEPLKDHIGTKVDQVLVGSCTNARISDLVAFTRFLEKAPVHSYTHVIITPASQQVMQMATEMGLIQKLVAAGAQITQPGCGACIGQHSAPSDNATSFRTINRNFLGRSGTRSADVFLGSPSSAAAAAVRGEITDPRDLAEELGIEDPGIYVPAEYNTINRFLVEPPENADDVEIERPPTIGPAIENDAYPEKLDGVVAIKVGDKISTDAITPAGKFLALRSNIDLYSEGTFFNEDETFSKRAAEIRDNGRHGIIVAGESYGEGSSREHAALCPMYLGIKVVLSKGFQRIHRENLINFGIIPAVFENPEDYDAISQGAEMTCDNVYEQLENGDGTITFICRKDNRRITGRHDLHENQIDMIQAGTKLNYLAEQG